MGKAWRGVLIGAALVLIVTEACAHSLNLFATTEGDVIQGRVYFSGGGAATGVPILAVGADGATQARAIATADGHFVLTVGQRQDYRLIAETADGHRAEFRIAAAELPASLPTAAAVHAVSSTAPSLVKSVAAPPLEPPLDGDRVPALIEAAVARQLAPLREQLAAYQTETRWRDVLGGIGYILGLTGIAAFLLARRRQRPGDSRAEGP